MSCGWRFLSPGCEHPVPRQAKTRTTAVKSRTKPALQAVPAAQVQLSLNVQGVLRDVQQAFYALRVNAGKQVLAAMMEADRVALRGANNVPDAGRKAVRGGTTKSGAVLGGQRIAVTKPQARRLEFGELELPAFAWQANTNPPDMATVASLVSTEAGHVVRSLLSDLVDRGLDAERARLWVIDGGRALRAAIVDCLGALALIQRCQEHKRRNVIEHLPQGLHAGVGRVMRDAGNGANAELAKKQLQRRAASLNAKHPGAAASLREGLEETWTVQSLGITGAR